MHVRLRFVDMGVKTSHDVFVALEVIFVGFAQEYDFAVAISEMLENQQVLITKLMLQAVG